MKKLLTFSIGLGLLLSTGAFAFADEHKTPHKTEKTADHEKKDEHHDKKDEHKKDEPKKDEHKKDHQN